MKVQYFVMVVIVIAIESTKLFAQVKLKSEDIELMANDSDDPNIPDRIRIDYTYNFEEKDSKYQITFVVKSVAKDLSVNEKKYNYFVKASNVAKDFRKDVFINNIVLYFYLDERTYSNAKDIKKKLNKVFDQAIETVKFDVERIKSDKEIKEIEKQQ